MKEDNKKQKASKRAAKEIKNQTEKQGREDEMEPKKAKHKKLTLISKK